MAIQDPPNDKFTPTIANSVGVTTGHVYYPHTTAFPGGGVYTNTTTASSPLAQDIKRLQDQVTRLELEASVASRNWEREQMVADAQERTLAALGHTVEALQETVAALQAAQEKTREREAVANEAAYQDLLGQLDEANQRIEEGEDALAEQRQAKKHIPPLGKHIPSPSSITIISPPPSEPITASGIIKSMNDKITYGGYSVPSGMTYNILGEFIE